MKLVPRYCSIALVFILSFSSRVEEIRAQDQSCIQRLQPCMDYLNGNRDPPSSCCDPLKVVIRSEPECLCSMISIRGANQAERAGINITQAQQLPGRCGVHINPLGCILGAPTSSSASFSFRVPSMAAVAGSWMMVSIIFSTL
ncbi:lipid transfer-like protein VAS [Coffea eugenioides]|uniref:Non-specific lipid transfer protein GPI-anchored 30-like n=1 Tax=Coffea arabica TaxID=13443 RepID=A0A6P6SB90_COFAR|nr:lipid transfer-like protein VAS [Coffea arabica]XP_027127465.1 lipid transfer-like protein VAS [Coffea arabica]XP_027172326.1 lipid transfer-like protein VAS [Coffea eugenioides]